MTHYYSPDEFTAKYALLFPKTTPYRFVYRGTFPRGAFPGINILFLLYDEEVGYTYKALAFYHASHPKTAKAWGAWVHTKGIGKLRDWWLPSHNAHYETEREIVKILLFHRQEINRGPRYR